MARLGCQAVPPKLVTQRMQWWGVSGLRGLTRACCTSCLFWGGDGTGLCRVELALMGRDGMIP